MISGMARKCYFYGENVNAYSRENELEDEVDVAYKRPKICYKFITLCKNSVWTTVFQSQIGFVISDPLD